MKNLVMCKIFLAKFAHKTMTSQESQRVTKQS